MVFDLSKVHRLVVWYCNCGGLVDHIPVIGHYFHFFLLSIFDPTSLTFLIPPLSFMPILLCLSSLYLFMLMNRRQEPDLIGTTGHRRFNLLGYRHPETVLFFFPDLILDWNPLSRPRLLPQFKVLDFLDMERESPIRSNDKRAGSLILLWSTT